MAFADFVRVKDPLVVMSSVTAPGADVPWDRAYCEKLGPHKCSEKLDRQVRRREAREWNRTAPARWRASIAGPTSPTARAHGTVDALWMLPLSRLRKAGRGVLHVHPVLALRDTPPEGGRRPTAIG